MKPLTPALNGAPSPTFLEGAVDLDDVVQRSVRLLAQLTRQVAIVQYPITCRAPRSATSSWWRWARHRMLLVLILSTGRVEQRLVELPGPVEEHRAADAAHQR